MHLIQSFKNETYFDLPLFSKYPTTSINSYFHKMTLVGAKKAIPCIVSMIQGAQVGTLCRQNELS